MEYNMIYTNNELLVLKMKEMLLHPTTQMNLEDIMLSELSQSQKDKDCIIAFI